ncbi:hypothetical protein ACFLS9_03000 [Bacteroidota bacterium]
MKNQSVTLNKPEQEHYQTELRTSSLVRLSYKTQCRKSKLTPDKLYALCKLTWQKGSKVSALWILWDKKHKPPKYISDISPEEFPKTVYEIIQYDIGIVNYYAAYRNSSLPWIRKNFKKLAPLVKRAAELKNDDDARELAEMITKLPGIPKPNKKDVKMSPASLLTPLFGCLDPRHRFPLVNKARHVVILHRKLGITNYSLEDQFNTLVRLIGQFGIKDALMLDVASNKISKVIKSKPNNYIKVKTKFANRTLDEKDDSDVEIILKSRSKIAVRLHNSMTNILTKLCKRVGYEVLEGSDPYKFDALIKNYDGKGKDLLIEAKSNCQRAHLRLAVGQLLDYRRGLKRRAVTDLAILLPEKPDKESLKFLYDVGIRIIWFNDSKLNSVKSDMNLKITGMVV